MSTTTATPRTSVRLQVQKFGTFLSGMIMPNIPALIAWGIVTMFFIPKGFTPNADLETIVGPTIHYLLPIVIGYTGGHIVYGVRGAVVAAIGTIGAIAGSDFLIAQYNLTQPDDNQLGQVHMFIGAMIMAPLAAYSMKWLDRLWETRIKAGLEMLVNMFSAGIWGFFLLIIGFYPVAWLVNGIMSVLSTAVNWLVSNNLLPLTSIVIEPAKVFFLNNAINHGVLTPLGTQEAAGPAGKSILFLLEANPGPGFGLLLAFAVFGIGAAKASAPGAAFIQFVGGIHEVGFPFALMKPTLILALVGGGMTGVTINMVLGGALRAPAAPGSILAVLAQTAPGAYVPVILSVVFSAAVSFVIAGVILRASRKSDLAAAASGEDGFATAVSQTEANKGKSSDALSGLLVGGTPASGPVKSIVFACDAGMGSSAMGASVLRKKIKAAGFPEVTVINKAIASLTDTYDIVVSHQDLMDRAAPKTPSAVHVSVDNFMASPRYDEVVEMVSRANRDREMEPAGKPASAAGVSATSSSGPATSATRTAPAPSSSDAAAAAAVGAAPVSSAPDEDNAVLKLSSIVLQGNATDRNGAITEAGNLLVASGNVHAAYVDSMHEREKSVSTYMGNLLAIPHGTNEAKSMISQSSISVTRYPNGIDWNGNPVRFVIGIAGAGNDHLELLGKIAEVFLDESKIAELESATSPQQIRDAFGRVNS